MNIFEKIKYAILAVDAMREARMEQGLPMNFGYRMDMMRLHNIEVKKDPILRKEQNRLNQIKAKKKRESGEDWPSVKRGREKQRERYHNDPEYREKCLAYAREYHRKVRSVWRHNQKETSDEAIKDTASNGSDPVDLLQGLSSENPRPAHEGHEEAFRP